MSAIKNDTIVGLLVHPDPEIGAKHWEYSGDLGLVEAMNAAIGADFGVTIDVKMNGEVSCLWISESVGNREFNIKASIASGQTIYGSFVFLGRKSDGSFCSLPTETYNFLLGH